MKVFSNLPGTLRVLFRFLRLMTIILGVFWSLTLIYNTWIQKGFGNDARLFVTVGEIDLPAAPGVLGLSSKTAMDGSLSFSSLRGRLQADLASNDDRLTSVLRWAIVPSMAALIVFSYILFGALGKVCTNLERGNVFTEENLRLVRRIGVILIVYSLVSGVLEIWASAILGSYFFQNVVLTGLAASVPFGTGTGGLHFGLLTGLFTNQGGVLIGALVLVVAEAFRQGLALKTENDLTV
jgi:hypothetical protein